MVIYNISSHISYKNHLYGKNLLLLLHLREYGATNSSRLAVYMFGNE